MGRGGLELKSGNATDAPLLVISISRRMRHISRRVRGAPDYVVGALLIAITSGKGKPVFPGIG
jgi:hypothetical protein